jgi:hypothetical protein
MPKIAGVEEAKHEPFFRQVPSQRVKIDKCLDFLKSRYNHGLLNPGIDYISNYVYWRAGEKELFLTFSERESIGYIKVWPENDEFGDILSDDDYDELFGWLKSPKKGLN